MVIMNTYPQESLKNKMQRKTGKDVGWETWPFPRKEIIMGILSLSLSLLRRKRKVHNERIERWGVKELFLFQLV